MPKKDKFHDIVKQALIKDGWVITDDPLRLQVGNHQLFIDLGAEKLIAAEKDNQKIAVEVKSFVSKSEVHDLENALGQFILYEDVLSEKEPDRKLFLAIRKKVFASLFEVEIGKILLSKKRVALIVFDENNEEILQWIS